MNKMIKSPEDHAEAVQRLDELMTRDPARGTPEGDELELLAHLIDGYERDRHDLGFPTPVEAIRFRMDQQGLKSRDMVPYMGSASKVSEILNGKRTLTLSMIRRLHEGLGIPAEVLIADPHRALPRRLPVEEFPFKVMFERGWFAWFTGTWADARGQAEELLGKFLGEDFDLRSIPALHRQSVRSGSTEDPFALHAWKTRVLLRASEKQLKRRFEAADINDTFLSHLRGLSRHADGPRTAVSLLEEYGIAVVIEAHLKGTHLDGAALRMVGGAPVIALTLRYDRLDNFWFCLFHELAHVVRHLRGDGTDAFFDNLMHHSVEEVELEADRFATDALIPPMEWEAFTRGKRISAQRILDEARRLVIHPAIIAGRIRRERDNYQDFSRLVGIKEVRKHFPEWRA